MSGDVLLLSVENGKFTVIEAIFSRVTDNYYYSSLTRAVKFRHLEIHLITKSREKGKTGSLRI